MKAHIIGVHDRLKNHKCDRCEKCFSMPGNLRKHIKLVHEGQKEHICDTCGKAFQERSALGMVLMYKVTHGRCDLFMPLL